jgi:hypothetical protein
MARTSERISRQVGLASLGVWLIACSLDQRNLQLDSAAGASTNGAGAGVDDGVAGSSGSTSTPEPDGGAAGEGQPVGAGMAGSPSTPALPPLVNGCADLDTDKVADCSVTLVKNPAFKSDVESWAAVDDAMLAWDAGNALGDTPSGCALLTASGTSDLDGSAFFRVAQCVAVPANQIVIAYANALVVSASAKAPAQAELEVSFFDAEDCAGQATGQFFTPPSAASAWTTIQAGGVSGLATKSASVALVGIKPYRAEALGVCFDNVMLKTQAP